MTRQVVQTDKAPQPSGAYSQGIVAGGYLFTAGVGPVDPTTGKVTGHTVGEQTARVMTSLKEILAAHGMGFENVVKTTVHLAELDRDFRAFNEVYESFLIKPYPVRTTVGSVLKNILVEIDMIAIIPS